jgi:concanavalin A-like lectin/glucanase superfamily protein
MRQNRMWVGRVAVVTAVVAAACGKVDGGEPAPDGGTAIASCSDGVRNGDETDVDCGGSCGACAADARCSADADCGSQRCSTSQCSPTCGLGGLVAYFPFDGDTLDHATDTHHDATASHVAATPGRFRGGYAFDGATSTMQLTGATMLSGARTLCAWVNAKDVSTFGNPVFTGGVPNAGDFFSLEGANPSNPCGQPGEPFIDHWGTACMKSGMPVASERWSLVCYASDGAGTVRFYKDGMTRGMAGRLFDYAISTLTIGSSTIGGSTTHASLLGAIDEVTIWDHALGIDELDRLWQGGRSCVP